MKGYFFKQTVIYSYSSATKKNKLWIYNYIQKSVAFLYTSNEVKEKFKKQHHS